MSADGRTALPNGSSQWISGPQARAWVHRLRAGCDAVIVGGGTVRADNPLLTSRGLRAAEPLRVVLSRQLDLPAEARLWQTSDAATLVAHGPEAPAEARARLDALGVERLELARCEPELLLEALAARGCNQVLWECGPGLAAAALRQGCVQRVAAVVAPKLLGGTSARTPLGDLGLVDVAQATPWNGERLSRLGDDLLWWLEPRHPAPPAPSCG
jgi:diaminohydroxyphosphoribosylaminopyrimidine deaminase/5-amino-6-(5-phosphoribosylamino)uracil reductase